MGGRLYSDSKYERVKRLVDGGMSVESACKKQGIKSATSYYYWRSKNKSSASPKFITIEEKPFSTKSFLFSEIRNRVKQVNELMYELERAVN